MAEKKKVVLEAPALTSVVEQARTYQIQALDAQRFAQTLELEKSDARLAYELAKQRAETHAEENVRLGKAWNQLYRDYLRLRKENARLEARNTELVALLEDMQEAIKDLRDQIAKMIPEEQVELVMRRFELLNRILPPELRKALTEKK